MHKYHHSATILELGPVVGITKNQYSTPKRNHQRSIRERFTMDDLVGCRPQPLFAIVGSRDIAYNNCTSNSKNPHEEGGTRKNHGERSHGGDTPEITLRVILLGMTRTDENTFDIPESALFQKRSPNVFANIVTYQINRNPVTTTKVHKSETNLGPRRQRENITPMGHQIKESLPIPDSKVSVKTASPGPAW
jgi:hypothetical protein